MIKTAKIYEGHPSALQLCSRNVRIIASFFILNPTLLFCIIQINHIRFVKFKTSEEQQRYSMVEERGRVDEV